LILAALLGDFFYRDNGGQIERAYCIRFLGFNGHDVYIDFEAGVVVNEWNEFGVFRVTPWMKYNP
jgi:hypothetical protein